MYDGFTIMYESRKETNEKQHRGLFDDKTPNCPSLDLLNLTKVALQTGKDSLRGLLCGSQDPRARKE